ncbi:hypothetical protein KJ855_01690 [Patescibacteria group bacterium]|nr:hypothetical protein [Patescibacteria group bacterium]
MIAKKVIPVFIFCLFLLTGCGEEKDYQISDIKVSDKRDNDTKLLLEPSNHINDLASTIYGQATFFNPNTESNTLMQIIWKHTESEEIITTNTIKTSQGGTILFSAPRPGFNWKRGEYTIEFIILDTTYAIYSFTVGETNPENEYISSIQTSSTVDYSHNPTSPSTTFPKTISEIYLTIETSAKMPKSTEIKVEWRYTQKDKFLSSAISTIGPEEKTHFTFDKKSHQPHLETDGNWPPGGYIAKIYLDNKFAFDVRFTIN